ncbi:MAG: hypothetical protein M3Y72_25170 [Acidobacteriota bacterium]|nr:hypothetical protein [Acidobacteriota bacterium]
MSAGAVDEETIRGYTENQLRTISLRPHITILIRHKNI